MEKNAQRIYLSGLIVETLKTYGVSAVLAFGILHFISVYINNVLLFFFGGILFLAPVLAPVVARLRQKKKILVDGKAVFISVLWGLVNNAGVCEIGELIWTPLESMQKMFDVNTFGVIRLTKAFLQKLKESRGRVVTVASLAGRCTVPFEVPYSISKTAVISFCEGLRLEIYKWDIQVITIEPGMYSTPLIGDMGRSIHELWASAPKHVKDMYGLEHSQDTLKNLYDLLSPFCRHPSEVISVIEEALTSLFPDYSYQVGGALDFFLFWVYKKLPKPIADMLLYKILQLFSESSLIAAPVLN